MINITFRADPTLIQKARDQARKAGMTLIDAFRNWLQAFAGQSSGEANYRELIKLLDNAQPGK